MQRLCRLILIMFIAFLPTCPAVAGGLSSPISARFENFYLDDAIVLLTETTDVSRLTCGPISGVVTMNFDNMALSQVLDQLAKAKQLIVTQKTDVIIVRSAAKFPPNAYASCNLTKLPVTDALKAVAEAYGLQLAVRGQLKGEVTDELNGTMKEILDTLAAKYGFKWSVSRNTVRVSAVQTK